MEQNSISFKGECSSEVLEEQFLNCFCWTKDLQANKLQGECCWKAQHPCACFLPVSITEPQDGLGWRDLRDQLIATLLPWAGTPSTHHPAHLQAHRFFICLGFAQFSGPAGVCCCQVPLDVTSCATCLSSSFLLIHCIPSSKPAPQPCLFPGYEK